MNEDTKKVRIIFGETTDSNNIQVLFFVSPFYQKWRNLTNGIKSN